MRRTPLLAAIAGGFVVSFAGSARANPPVPSGAHPRLFMGATNLAAYTSNATKSGTAANGLVKQCDDTISTPGDYTARGGSDGNAWPQAAVACAFAYVATQQAKYLTQALKYWQASLDDDQTIGDHLGCVSGVSTDWHTWYSGGQMGAAPPVIKTITHDTGYPIRWYAPDVALAYDWLYSATGVTASLLAQTRVCLGNWIDYYALAGYHHDEAGANYNAGYVVGKALAAVAIGNDAGADGHLWNDVLTNEFATVLIGKGLAGSSGQVGTPAGPMVGGGWGEGWQYGALSVLEYAAAARALEDQSATLPEMDEWANALFSRNVYATVPSGKFEFCGDGDCDITTPNKTPNVNELDAVLIARSSDQAAAWALSSKQAGNAGKGTYVYNAIAETRVVTPQDFTKQNPAPPLWYLARGVREMYARTSWDSAAFWAVFASPPQVNSDHQHFVATNFVFSRGADDLIVDPTPYGGGTSWEANALTAEASVVQGDYTPSQTPWSKAELLWARATADATFAARSDIAKAFDFSSTPSDVTYAHREWVMLPEGEIVTIDRVHTSAATRKAYVTFHANTGGTLALTGNVATGTVGGSKVAIHAVMLSGGTPAITKPTVGDCTLSCSYPCAMCDVARFANDQYQVAVPGAWAVAIHAIDGLASGDAPATVASMNDDAVDPAPKQNAGVIGASVLRAQKQAYVVATSAQDGATGAMMTYGVPGASAANHVVYDAPEASDGTSAVTTSVSNGRCVVTIAAGSGGGFAGHPLMFAVSDAASGCKATDGTSAPPGQPMPGGDGGTTSPGSDGGTTGPGPGPGVDGGANGDAAGGDSGCGCNLVGSESRDAALLVGALFIAGGAARRRSRRRA